MVVVMVSAAEQWRRKRTEKFRAPSGDYYVLRIPDPLTLIEEWRKAGVQTPLDEKDLGEKISQPKVIAHILRIFIKEPRITEKPSTKSLGIQELMQDQTDCVAIYRRILRPFIEGGDDLARFFRSLQPSTERGPNSSLLSPAADRSAGSGLQGSGREDHVEPADSKPHSGLAQGTGHRQRGP